MRLSLLDRKLLAFGTATIRASIDHTDHKLSRRQYVSYVAQVISLLLAIAAMIDDRLDYIER